MADILHDSGLVKDDVIKKELRVDAIQFNAIGFGNPSDNPALEEWELGRLANHIDHGKLVTLAAQHFHEQLTSAQIANIKSNNVGDAWSASFEILVHWRNKPGNNRQVSLVRFTGLGEPMRPRFQFHGIYQEKLTKCTVDTSFGDCTPLFPSKLRILHWLWLTHTTTFKRR